MADESIQDNVAWEDMPPQTPVKSVVEKFAPPPDLSNYVQDDDPRLSDRRTPKPHKATHSTGGDDALAPADIGAAPAAHSHGMSDVSGLEDELSGVEDRLSDVESSVSAIEELVPEQASASNQLADKDFVNSSVSTNTATFRGTYNLVTDLGLAVDATEVQTAAAVAAHLSSLVPPVVPENNDYVFVQVPRDDAEPAVIGRIDRYKCTVVQGVVTTRTWGFEWSLNNSSFTAAQWAAINSGITADAVEKLSGIAPGAQVNVIETVKVNGTTLTPEQKAVDIPVPVVGTAAAKDVPASGNAATDQVVLGSDTRLSDSRTPTAHKSTHSEGGSDALAPSDIGAATPADIRYDLSVVDLGQLQDHAVQKITLSTATTTLILPNPDAGKVVDFVLDVVNGYSVSGSPAAASLSLSGIIGTDYNIVVADGQSWSNISEMSEGEMAEYYFTLTSFALNEKRTWRISKQTVVQVKS